MAVKIRLQRRGRTKRPFYHIVVADARAPRDGRFIEKIGTYNPMTVPATIDLDSEKAFDWLAKGAQPTDTARAILRFKGVLYRKHLMRGVKKGALTEDQAASMLEKWVNEKEARVATRRQKVAEEKKAWHLKISGTPKNVPVAATEQKVAKSGGEKPEADNKSFAESVEQTTVDSFAGTKKTETEAPADATPAAPAAKEATTKVLDDATAAKVEEAAPAKEAPAKEAAPAKEETAPVAEKAPAKEAAPAKEETPPAAEKAAPDADAKKDGE